MAQSPLNYTTRPVDSEEEGRSSTMDRQWLIEKKTQTDQRTQPPQLTAMFLKHPNRPLHGPANVLHHSFIQSAEGVDTSYLAMMWCPSHSLHDVGIRLYCTMHFDSLQDIKLRMI